MQEVKRKAYAKINLGLDVIRRRRDGYHEVSMIMQTVGLYDELTFKRTGESGIHIFTDHSELPTDSNNLIYQAAVLLKNEFSLAGGIQVHLAKRIPVAAGMAGGSSDAAAVFHGFNELFDLKMSREEMCRLGVTIGADVPYCITGGTVLAQGIGEILTPLPPAPCCYVLIAKPDIAVSTKFVYENLHADTLEFHPDIAGMAEAVRAGSLLGITQRLGNVLERVTIRQYPVIEKLKRKMLNSGAEGALMSGSGPTVFGLFREEDTARHALAGLEKEGMARQICLTTFV